jgi:rhodanese-related sulfurtransferase
MDSLKERCAMTALLKRSFLIVGISLCLGLFANTVSPRGIPLFGPVPEVPDSSGMKSIGLEEAYSLFLKPDRVFVDSRSDEEFREGHIQGARLLDYYSFEESVSTFRDLIPADTTLVTYCAGEGCGSSREVAELLKEEGYQDIRVFVGGWDRWQEKGYPVEKGVAASGLSDF